MMDPSKNLTFLQRSLCSICVVTNVKQHLLHHYKTKYHCQVTWLEIPVTYLSNCYLLTPARSTTALVHYKCRCFVITNYILHQVALYLAVFC